jgi:hypothetical protein
VSTLPDYYAEERAAADRCRRRAWLRAVFAVCMAVWWWKH